MVGLKFSGKAISGPEGHIDLAATERLVSLATILFKNGISVQLTVGGGNLFRGAEHGKRYGFKHPDGDTAGMTATVFNATVVRGAFHAAGIKAAIFGPNQIDFLQVRKYDDDDVKGFMKEGIVIFAGGTGIPVFTTDTGAAIRACATGADMLVKLTNVQGVYDKDPNKDSSAKLLPRVHYSDVSPLGLRIIDKTAVSVVEDRGIKILVVNYSIAPKDLLATVLGKKQTGSIIGPFPEVSRVKIVVQ